ncbi:MAG: ISL3 family transposase [bacterium]
MWNRYRIVERLYYHSSRIPDEREFPKRVGIDDFSSKKGQKYNSMIVDLDRSSPLEVLPGRDIDTLNGYFQSQKGLSRVREATMDMWKPFFRAVKENCPKARITIDRFHVIQLSGGALNSCRKRLQWRVKGEERKKIRRIRKLLFLDPCEIPQEEVEEFNAISYEELKGAYILYQYLKRLYDFGDINKARRGLRYWLHRIKDLNIPEFLDVAKTIRRWRRYILNYFLSGLTNGVVEGIINKIKLIKRMAYGLKFPHLRFRILVECGELP